MVEALKHGWWLLVLRGVCALLFGVLTFAWPGLSLLTLVSFFGAYALVNGIFTLMIGLRASKGAGGAGVLVWLGLLGVVAGILTFFYPGVTALTLLWLIAFWAILTGFLEITAAIRLRRVVSNEWLMILGGALSVIFGVLVLAMPGAGALSVLWLIGAYAVAYGVMMLALAFRIRGLASRVGGAAPA